MHSDPRLEACKTGRAEPRENLSHVPGTDGAGYTTDAARLTGAHS